MKPTDHIDDLKRIRQVNAPPHLLNKIHARIVEQAEEKFAPAWAFSLAAAIALLLMFNIMHVAQGTNYSTESTGSEVASTMNLIQSNQLYHE